ncbi:MAG TPA: hypothetical protein VJV78_30620 [Polyangiales bacterium]|nr:hypothetical protein [Polyangiales bacterium]
MSEMIFPLVGPAFVIGIVLPSCALFAKCLLLWLEQEPLRRLHVRHLALVASSILPLAWLMSAALHQAESSQIAIDCLFDHQARELCFEPGLFALALLLFIAQRTLSMLRGRAERVATTAVSHSALGARIERVIAGTAELAALRSRVRVTAQRDFAVGTQGIVWPKVVVGESFAAELADDELASALGHEAEHVRVRDPLRYLLVELALALNPLGRRLLEPHAARWYAAREAQCDREAVSRGCAPLPLAQAILRAARPAPAVVPLGARDPKLLRFRIDMLLAFAERKPSMTRATQAPALSLGVALLALAVLLPHKTSTAALDVLHVSAERALTFVWD